MTEPAAALYAAIDAFQREHRIPGLQHAQIRGLLAEHLARVVPVPPADRAAVLNEAADAVFAMDFDEYVENDENIDSIREAWDLGTIHGMELLRRLAAEAQPVCAECGHPHAAHREGDDPVTPGTCSACTDDDRHDYVPAAEAQQGAATALAPSAPGANEPASSVAAEAQPTTQPETEAHPAEHSWAAELYDPLAEEWVPGTRYLVRDRAVNHLAHARAIGPTWKDGTPTARRLVRATTTYTVEPETEPAAGARQDEEPS